MKGELSNTKAPVRDLGIVNYSKRLVHYAWEENYNIENVNSHLNVEILKNPTNRLLLYAV